MDLQPEEELQIISEEQEILIITCIKNGITVTSEQNCLSLSEGETCFLCSPIYVSAGEKPGRCIVLAFSGELVQQVLSHCMEQQRFFCTDQLTEIYQIVKLLENETVSLPKCTEAAFHLLMQIYQHAKQWETEKKYPPLVEAAVGIMQEEFAFLDGIDSVSERLGVTENHLVRQFSASVGMSPGKYLRKCRLEYAKALLIQGDLSINMIAQLSGFSCANYFGKVFRREYGIPPGAYAQIHAGEKPNLQIPDELYL